MAGGVADEVKLLGHWGSPFVTRVKLAFHLKGVSYEYAEEDLHNKSELLLRSNPVHKAVPVLIHNGRPICESQVILQYIDETFDGNLLLPADPHERAVARFWAAYIDNEMGAPWEKAYRARTAEERAEWMKQIVAAVDALEGGLRECSKGKGGFFFFGGGGVGYVDVVLGSLVPYVHAAVVLSGDRLFDAGRTPLLAAWLERFGELDLAKAVLQDVDKVVEYSRAIYARNAAGVTS
ncbi:probable glutathione S-transferase GSTU6 [Brachypodium distachyon]|uniref:Glutathione S-transferase n=1 Tax=Brachypodium distachyon TaxID=15368 RepID=I1HJC6_BRADI|nr:probable glutathione S-transferase GSTU6 [Brachypodium distachyon]KQK06215.1 hypothetical protein BRADI_2g25170v3 [Brachypodium distachyon]|eukprot:XP_003566236.1 probable glutathione S-transferase GSTU6 [Brachypodium distachyon]